MSCRLSTGSAAAFGGGVSWCAESAQPESRAGAMASTAGAMVRRAGAASSSAGAMAKSAAPKRVPPDRPCLLCELTRLQKAISTLETVASVPTIKRAFSQGVDESPAGGLGNPQAGPKTGQQRENVEIFSTHARLRGKLCAL
jgi:hypothetical protein